MSALDRVIQYYEEGSINELELLGYCENVGMTNESIDKVIKLANHRRDRYLARLRREQKINVQDNQETSL